MSDPAFDFAAAGFSPQPTTADSIENWVKVFPAEASPYIREHMIGMDGISETMTVEVWIRSSRDGWTIEMDIDAADYREDPMPLASEEGQGLFRDAAAVVNTPKALTSAATSRRPHP